VRNFQLTLCLAAVLGGIMALLNWGATPPPWLAGTEAALIMAVALSYGFTARLPRIPWLALRPVRGTVLVTLGCVCVFIPPQLILAAYLIGRGVRLVWLSACQLAAQERLDAVGQRYGEYVPHEAVQHEPMDYVPVGQASVRGYLSD
jgi:hypothetical protein